MTFVFFPPPYVLIKRALNCFTSDDNALLVVPLKHIVEVVRNSKLANYLAKNFRQLEYLSLLLNYILPYQQLSIITLRLDT